MVGLPADVQTALDAYLAARIDQATWRAYIAGLGPGLALDVATYLCAWTLRDEQAADWLRRNYEADPDDPEYMPGDFWHASRSLSEFLRGGPGEPSYLTLSREALGPDDVGWTVQLLEGDSESEATVTLAEWQQWAVDWPVTRAWRPDPWAVAACRALCYSWWPEWARGPAHAD